MPKHRIGKDFDELRLEWRRCAEKAEQEIMGKYYARRAESGGYGHEGLGVYGNYKERVARKKSDLAAKLLEREGLEVTMSNVRKLVRKARDASGSVVVATSQEERQKQPSEVRVSRETARVIPFLRRPEPQR